MRKVILPLLFVIGGGMVVGCDTSSPSSPAQQTAMRDEAKATLEQMEAQDPSLANTINNSVGYAVFPEVGAGAIGIGGAEGRGFVYRDGHRIGLVKMTQASVGAQIGGQTYAELIIFQDDKALGRIMNDSLEFSGDASATAVKAGAAGSAQFSHGTQIYVLPKGGLFAGIAVAGQKFHFMGNGQTTTQTETTTTNNNNYNPTTQPSNH